MTFANTPPIEQQIGPGTPIPNGLVPVSAPLYPPQSLPFRLRSFSPEIYNLTATSHLFRLLGVLLGDAGGEQLRKRGLVSRLQATLASTSFLALDAFWGALFNLNRNSAEALPVNPNTGLTVNPYSDSAFPAVWNAAHQSDTYFRSRIFQFAQAVSYGPSPVGIKKMAEAVLNCPVDLYETFQAVPANYQATIVPWRPITMAEMYNLHNILNVFKPADARINISQGAGTTANVVPLAAAWADSSYWEVQGLITPGPSSLYSQPTQRSRFAFSAYQGETWELNSDIAAVTAQEWDYQNNVLSLPAFEHYIWPDGTFTNFTPAMSVMPGWQAELGRLASSGVTQANPVNNVSGSLSGLIMDGMDAGDLANVIQTYAVPTAVSSSNYFWSTPPRQGTDTTQEVIQYSFKQPQLVDSFSFQVANFPHNATLYVQDPPSGSWIPVNNTTMSTCSPQSFGDISGYLTQHLHPQHTGPNAWLPVSIRMNPAQVQNIQIRLTRFNGVGPVDAYGNPTAYSLGVRDFVATFVLDDPQLLPLGPSGTTIDTTTTVLGDQATYSTYLEDPNTVINTANSATSIVLGANLTAGTTYNSITANAPMTIAQGSMIILNHQQVQVISPVIANATIPTAAFTPTVTYTTGTTLGLAKSQWRCNPQVSADSVVNFFVDTRTTSGPQVIDRFYVEPTHVGTTCNLYWTQQTPNEGPGSGGPSKDQILAVTPIGVSTTTQGLSFGAIMSDLQIPASEVAMANGPWWIGISFTLSQGGWATMQLVNFGGGAPGSNRVYMNNWQLTFNTAGGDNISIGPVNTSGQNNLVFGVIPPGWETDLGSNPNGTLYIGLNGTSATAVPAQIPNLTATSLTFGTNVFSAPFILNDFVLKGEALTQETANSYMEAPVPFCYKGQYRFQDTGQTDNAYVRFDPNLMTTANPYGFVGGTPDSLADLEWIPLVKDFILTRGQMNFRPTLATFWRFEMTNLAPEPYGIYLPQIPGAYQAFSGNASTPGVGASTYQGGLSSADAAVIAQTQGEQPFQTQPQPTPEPDPRLGTPTTTLVATTPQVGQALANQFFSFGYTPQYQSPAMPVNDSGGTINYTTSTVTQNQQMAFFCGFYLVQALRTNSASPVDTPIYYERFLDEANYIF